MLKNGLGVAIVSTSKGVMTDKQAATGEVVTAEELGGGDVHTLVYPRPKQDGIIRVSVGCEDVDDLLEDFALGLSFVRP